MQGKYQTFLDFSARTDALAAKLEVDVQDLPEVVGFSRASLFAYRAGKARISEKAWLKLQSAEEAAGLGPQRSDSTVAEMATVYGAPPVTDMASLMVAVNRRLDQIGEAITRMAGVLENADLRPLTAEETVVRYWGCLGEAPAKDSRAATIKVKGQWPAHYFAVRVSGHHLAPDFPDQALVMVRPLRAGEHSDNILTFGDMSIPGITVALAWEVL